MSDTMVCDRCNRNFWIDQVSELTLEETDEDGNVIDTRDMTLCQACREDAIDMGFLPDPRGYE